MVVMLQWNQPFESYGLGNGSAVDLDLYVYDSPTVLGNVLVKSTLPQNPSGVPGGDPSEVATLENTTNAPLRVYLAINHFSGSRANTIFRVIFTDSSRLTIPMTPTGGKALTIYGHSACAEALTTGAIFYADIDSGGGFAGDTNAINVEGYSSKGGMGATGVPYYFDTTGQPIAGGPLRRDKPDFCAPDGGNTSVFGSDISIVINGVTYDTDSLPNFFGTSAAAPNAAAVAALLKERASLSTPAQLKKVLQGTAIDLIAAMPLSVAGPDDRSGAGLINALAAMNTVPGITQQPTDVLIEPNQNASFVVDASGSATLMYQWQKNGTDIPGENGKTLSLQNQPLSADGTVFTCVVSNDFGVAISKPARLFINHMPTIVSGPTATPPVAKVGVAVQFSIVTQDFNGQPLTIAWDFGDGTNGSGATVSHMYAAPGLYMVSVTGTDSDNQTVTASLTEVIYADANGDGQPDVDPAVDNTFLPEAIKQLNGLTPVALDVKKVNSTLNFKMPNKDTLQVMGTLPLPANFVAENKTVTVIVGGVGRMFTLNAKGKAAAAPDATFMLTFRAKKPVPQIGKYTFKIVKGQIKTFLAASGLGNETIKNELDTVRVTIYFNGVLYDGTKVVKYNAMMGKTGTAR